MTCTGPLANARLAEHAPIGGNPPWDLSVLHAHRATDRADVGFCLFASGRDAYLAEALGPIGSFRPWILPAFLCPVVPAVLRQAHRPLHAYRPGQLDALPLPLRRESTIVLAYDVDRPPLPADRAACPGDGPGYVLEDRCLWAGLPSDVPPGVRAIGSLRKWLGGAGGGWRSGSDLPPPAMAPPPAAHHLALAAAGALRALRLHRAASAPELADDASIADANRTLADAAERALGLPTTPRAAPMLARALLPDAASAHALIQARHATACALAAALDLPAPALGCIGLRLTCRDAATRDAALNALAASGIFAAVHWRDGDWSGDDTAAKHAATTFTLPCPPLPSDRIAHFATCVQDALR